ncbi:MAG: hypothetical protein WA604_13685 [Candidatus Sulfotelmatobacter sp.]
MRLVRRILTTVVVTCAVIFIAVEWIAPVALSFYEAKKVPPVARVVPTDLKDASVSQAPGMKLSYLGYEFEVPWTDLDESKTKLYPKDNPDKKMAFLFFRSGLRLVVKAVPPREWARFFATDWKLSPQQVEAFMGHEAAISDYVFLKNIYAFTPNSMHYWALSSRLHAREQMLLMIKSIVPSKPAETGIFNLRNPSFRGFQQGDPQIRQDTLLLNLYSANDSFEIAFLQKDYRSPSGVTQPEINRIVQSLHKAVPSEVAASAHSAH